MKRIIVTQNVYRDEKKSEFGDKIDHRIINWLAEAGYFPITISNFLLEQKSTEFDLQINKYLSTAKPDGLLLTGGLDLGLSNQRDATENYLISYFENRNLPILGLCRGMQVLATREGASLKPIKGHVGVKHFVNGKITGLVNSFHNWGFFELPENLEALAVSEDGSIEAFRHKSKQNMGLMWHPERETNFCENDLSLTRRFFK